MTEFRVLDSRTCRGLRTGELLNLRSEKIDKLVVDNAVQESLAGWHQAKLVDWTCAESPLMYDDTEGRQRAICQD